MRSRYPDLGALEIFAAIAEGASFTEAAKKTGVTISAVSQAMAQLEKDLGANLLDRSVRPVALTVYGRNLARAAAPVLEEARGLKSAVRPAPGRWPLIRLGLAESVSRTLAPWLAADLASRSDDLTLRTGMTRSLLEDFLDGELDLLVSASPMLDGEGIFREAVYRETFFVVYPSSWDSPVETPQDVHRMAARIPLVRYNALASDRVQTERIFRREGIGASRVLGVESSYTMTGLVAQGAGWAFMPPFNIWQGEPFAGEVRFARPESLRMERTMWVVARSPEFEGLVPVVASSIRGIVEKQMIPRLAQVSEALAAGVEILA